MRLVLILFLLWTSSTFADSISIPANPQLFTIEALKKKCIEFSGIKMGNGPDEVADCRVSEFGTVGVYSKQNYYYSIYCMIPTDRIQDGGCSSNSPNAQYFRARAMAIFVSNELPGQVALLAERAEQEIGLIWYEKPQFIINSVGTLLYLPIHLDGTGAGNLSEYYFWDEKTKHWQQLETNSWIKDIQIPPGLSISKGIWPDLKNMTAVAYFYRKNDANCCPTGGTAQLTLAIESGRLTIKSETLKLDESKENN